MNEIPPPLPQVTAPRGAISRSEPDLPDTEIAALREAAQALEATFLSEMLKQARFGEARDSFGGGVGESQFASFLRQEHAQALADRGGIGLAEQLFQSMASRAAADARSTGADGS